MLLVTERFVELAQATFQSRGITDPPMVLMPRTEDTEYSDRKTMERICDETFRRVLDAVLVRPAGEVRPS